MARTIAKDHDTKRYHILKVAAEVFAREGIERASMNAVARSCGISKANIYHYYSSKDDLIFDILDSYLSELRDMVCALDLSALAPADQLVRITREILLAYDGMDHEHKIQGEGVPRLPAPQQDILKGYQRELVTVMSNVLIRCAPDTLGQDRAKCHAITMSVFGMLNWFYMWQPKATKDARIAYAATVADLTLNGLTEQSSALH